MTSLCNNILAITEKDTERPLYFDLYSLDTDKSELLKELHGVGLNASITEHDDCTTIQIK